METVLSGIRPTGNLHLGNYFGAMKSFLKMQDEYNCYFFIADWHSLTTHPHPDNILNNTHTILAEYLACGLDPNKATIYVQSDVKEVLELYMYLNMNAYLGELERTTTFKDKARKQPNNVNAGLLTYPTLMASDILMHRAHKVPVGKDQEQNMEMARKFARRFNHIYEVDLFPEPESFSFGKEALKIPGLDGSGKMGKSEGNAIYLMDDEKTIKQKVMKAVTDSGPTEPNSPKPEPIANLFTFLSIVSTPDTYQHFDEAYNKCEIRYGDLKKQLAEDINACCAPIREKIIEYRKDTDLLERVAKEGAEKARENARQTVEMAREIIGFPKMR
ncbi:tryptophan--tRNA ligase [Porphyromonas sp. HMSC077F02]|uniref:tryptophan--tRNA ligase n=1 Tax=Porphyromonas TaxID=836 RepID=UPI00033EE74E|nr:MULTISPECIES: tryptophan--tRNA ligase [Porphyromonas]MDD7558109.1 tryptophan--tRNA ligase [Porphyromonas somerae]MDY3120078.1 tryptophan--tRNA ligase [Porphyromonas somerae]MDY3885152.1 tryptophan--tRNA ligase [Porphyromonas somerae]MDY5815616.1 tryptophan--tRNA ligase [Porphyromonas somerae]OFO58843.1 tryptophan--tRNA ligase [Porphyromonas sp. HMSC077F02]